jgi:carbonic anhydrase
VSYSRRRGLRRSFVHQNAEGVLAVVGVFFRIDPEPNALLDKILLAAPETAGEEVHVGKASPAELFARIGGVRAAPGGPVRLDTFYAYEGSLTTPGCSEGVLWSVLADGGQVSYAAVSRFHKVIAQFPYNRYPNNNRPLQPVNGQVIRLRRGARHG